MFMMYRNKQSVTLDKFLYYYAKINPSCYWEPKRWLSRLKALLLNSPPRAHMVDIEK